MDKKIQKDQKTQLPLLKSPEQKQGTVHAPGTQHHYRVVVSHPSGHSPTLTLWKEPVHPPNGEQVSKGTCYLFSLPSCCSRGPSKALPEFFVWLLINFYILMRSRTLVSNNNVKLPLWVASIIQMSEVKDKVKLLANFTKLVLIDPEFKPKCILGKLLL